MEVPIQWGSVLDIHGTLTFPLAMNISPYCILGGYAANIKSEWSPAANKLFLAYNISATGMSYTLASDSYHQAIFWAVIGE